MNKNFIVGGGVAAFFVATTVMAAGDWTVSKVQPSPIGEEVVRESRNYSIEPDASWTAPDAGLVQAVFYDHDPKCDELIGYLKIERESGIFENYPVPTAPPEPGKDCTNTVDGLWSSKVVTVAESNIISGEVGETSGYLYFEFATYTPEPTATETSLPPETVEPTSTSTSTSTPSPSPTATETVEMMPVLPSCVSIEANPPLPQAIASEGYTTTLHIEALNPEGYTLFDGNGYLFFESEPFEIVVYPNRSLLVYVGDTDTSPCRIGALPTNLGIGDQPSEFILNLPFVLN